MLEAQVKEVCGWSLIKVVFDLNEREVQDRFVSDVEARKPCPFYISLFQMLTRGFDLEGW